VYAFHKSLRVADGAEAQKLLHARCVDPARNQAGGKQSADFRGEEQKAVTLEIIKRLFAQTVAGDKQPLRGVVPDGEGKHAAEEIQAFLAENSIGLEHNFRITVAAELDSTLLQEGANFGKVKNLTVVNDPVLRSRVGHGLVAGRRKIKDGKAAVGQANMACATVYVEDLEAAVIRPAMSDRLAGDIKSFSSNLALPV